MVSLNFKLSEVNSLKKRNTEEFFQNFSDYEHWIKEKSIWDNEKFEYFSLYKKIINNEITIESLNYLYKNSLNFWNKIDNNNKYFIEKILKNKLLKELWFFIENIDFQKKGIIIFCINNNFNYKTFCHIIKYIDEWYILLWKSSKNILEFKKWELIFSLDEEKWILKEKKDKNITKYSDKINEILKKSDSINLKELEKNINKLFPFIAFLFLKYLQ